MAAFLSLASSTAFAACFQDDTYTTTCHPATSYELTIQKVELCKDSSCSDTVTVASSTQSFDIGSVGAGAAVGNYADLDTVPAGVYSHVRTTISPNIDLVAPAAGLCPALTSSFSYTNSAGSVPQAELTANADFPIEWNGSVLEHTYELSRNVVISKSASLPQIQVDFSTSTAALCLDIPSPGSPIFVAGVPDISIRIFDN